MYISPSISTCTLVPGFDIGSNFFLVYSPEREDPGNPDFDTSNIPKVMGGSTESCREVGLALYEQVIKEVVSVNSTQSAEMTKLLENIHRAVNIGLVNELKPLADRMGIDIYEVIQAASTKPFGFVSYYPGPGLGEWSKFRSFSGDNLWSICGVTHTISSHGAMDSIANLVSSPVQPWDALVCTSYAVKNSVEEMLSSQIDYLRHRLKATQFPLPQLPVIPLGIDTKKFAPPSLDEKLRVREIFGIGPDEIVCLFVVINTYVHTL